MVPVTTIAGAVGLGIAAAIPQTAAPIGVVLSLPTTYLLTVFEGTAALPGAVAPVGDVHPALSAVYGVGLLVWAGAGTVEGRDLIDRLRSSRLLRPLAAGAGVLCAAGIATTAGLGSVPRPLVVAVLDVGHGDAIFVRGASGRTVLIDGGANPSALLSQVGRRMGLAERSFSAMILTRADTERLPGLIAAAERYPPGLTVAPPEGSPSALFQRWHALASPTQSVPVHYASTIEIEPGLSIELTPTDPLPSLSESGSPQRTLVARLVYGEVSMLVAPSLTPEGGRTLMRSGWPLHADAFVVPRHGASAGLDPALLAAIQPRIAVIPVGAGNRSGLPARETLEALRDISVFRTDLNGTVELRTDGKTLWAIPER